MRKASKEAANDEADGRMTLAFLAARILLGALFTLSGGAGLLLAFGVFGPVPAGPTAFASEFQHAAFASHYIVLPDAVQLLAGLAVLAGRYVRLALVALGGVLLNVWAFHLTMTPSASAFLAPFVATALWIATAWPIRASFAPLFAART